MLRSTLTIALAAFLATAAAAQAATLFDAPADDDAFRRLCDGGACETAVAELRGGGRGENELDARAGSGFANPQTDFAIASGETYHFRVQYDASQEWLAIGAGKSWSDYAYDLVAFTREEAARFVETRTLFIRANASAGADRATTLSDLRINGERIGGLAVSRMVGYLAVGDVDFTRSFTIDGAFSFLFPDSSPRSRVAAQFKFTDVDPAPAPVPVPAAGLLLLGGLGALGAARLRRRG